MKNLISPLLVVALCFIVLFSCGDNSINASLDGSNKSEKVANAKKSIDKSAKKEVLDQMKKANEIKEKERLAEQMAKNKKKRMIRSLGEGQAEQSSREQRRLYEEVKDLPATAKQKEVANDICDCLNNNPLFKTTKNSKSTKAMINTLGEDKDKEAKAMQDCYSNKMVFAIKDLGKDSGVFSKKSRKYLNENCLNGNDKFWIYLGGYLTRNYATPTGVQ